MPRHPKSSLALVLGLAVWLAAPVRAQDVEYTTVTKVELSGFLGTMMKLAGGSSETTEKTYIKGARMRTDIDKTSSILDLEAGRIIEIDHGAKTYMMMTFEQMVAMLEKASADVQQAARAEQAEPAEKPEGEVDLKYSMKVDPTNERQKVNGHDARRFFMTMETDVTVTPEGEEAQQAGKLVILGDLWNAPDVPAARAMEAFAQRAPELSRRGRKATEGMAAAFAGNPGLKSAIEESAEEAQKLEGFTMRSTTYIVLVPPDLAFDREAALNPKPKAGAGDAVKRGIGGMLRGRLGGGDKEEPEKEEAPAQSTFMKLISETKDMKTGTLSEALFAPPSGYREVPFPGTGG